MKKMITRTVLAMSAATLAVGGIAYAQMPEGTARAERPKMDANGDGVVTRAEAMSAAEAMFARMDVNKDGKLDPTDREARRADMKANMFEKLDANKDGSISKAEFTNAEPMGRHGKQGRDGDAMTDGDKSGKHMGKRGHHRGGRHGGMDMARMADTNNDGAVSKAEFMTAATKHFDEADANRDGKITKEERQAMHAKMRAAWKADRNGPGGPDGPDDNGDD